MHLRNDLSFLSKTHPFLFFFFFFFMAPVKQHEDYNLKNVNSEHNCYIRKTKGKHRALWHNLKCAKVESTPNNICHIAIKFEIIHYLASF